MPKSKLKTISTNKLQEIIKTSTSFEEALQIIGYKSHFTATIPQLKNECDLRNINYNHLILPTGYKKCLQCGSVKKIEDFYTTRQICKECTKTNEKIKYHKKTNELNEYKKTLKCQKCGCNKFYLIDFHHLDPETKNFTISENSRTKFETLLKEIDKCIPLCSNCHREFHYLNEHNNITIKEYLDGYSSGDEADLLSL